MTDRDTWIAVDEMIRRYGDEAVRRAAIRAGILLAQNDKKGSAVWKRIAAAIDELTSTELGETAR